MLNQGSKCNERAPHSQILVEGPANDINMPHITTVLLADDQRSVVDC